MLEGEINRFEAARQVCEVLRNDLGEPEDKSWQQALELKDIYECNRCVGNVAQAYVKGIIEPGREGEFCGNDIISEVEKKQIISRVFSVSARKRPKIEEKPPICEKIPYEKALELREKGALFIDVRDKENFEGRYGEVLFTNMPYREMYQNPQGVSPDKKKAVVLRCNKGYLSTLAAKLLIEQGYEQVYVLDTTQARK